MTGNSAKLTDRCGLITQLPKASYGHCQLKATRRGRKPHSALITAVFGNLYINRRGPRAWKLPKIVLRSVKLAIPGQTMAGRRQGQPPAHSDPPPSQAAN